jgi:hypothetical protein
VISSPIALRDQPADGHARETIKQGQHGLPNSAADILEIHVDAFRAGRCEHFRKVGRTMVDGSVEAKFLCSVAAFFRAASV